MSHGPHADDGRQGLQETVGGFISGSPDRGAGLEGVRPAGCVDALRCPVCGSEFRPRRSWQSFCSSRCRRLASDVRELAQALDQGQAEGLRDELRAALQERVITGPRGPEKSNTDRRST
jgi:hypothetical protein